MILSCTPQIGLAADQGTRGILSKVVGGVPSRAVIVCSPECQSSKRQVAARRVRGQALASRKEQPQLLLAWPNRRLPSSLLTGPRFPTPALLGQFNKTQLNLFFFPIELYTLTSSLRTCESVASSTFAVLSDEIDNSKSLDSISVTGNQRTA